ncbi:hypothetical protein [Streptomyces sp. NPDC012888]|uniref:hypothetical protein n=1 Tax=Streptomyces sp. NPDC012888 TaxID=3364855 RepID=UPI0036A07D01
MPATHRRHRRRLIVVTAAAFAVTASPAVSAAPTASVSPGSVAPGGRVALNVQGCGTKTGRAFSTAFPEVALTPGNLEATSLFGAATVHRDARTGVHPVTFECGGPGGQRVTVSLEVTPGAARGGTGGSIGGVSPGQIALGGALAAGALGAGIWVLRRRTAGGH